MLFGYDHRVDGPKPHNPVELAQVTAE
jgi:hypothetical protein